MLWIPITLVAALAQAFRFMFQKRLRVNTLSTGGATFSRFFYSAPLIVIVTFTYLWARGADVPDLSLTFWLAGAAGGVCQITATMCVVALFQQRNFSVGITFKKTEVILAAMFGLILLGEGVSLFALIAILIGVAGVVILSDPPKSQGAWRARIWNRATALGLASGVFFGLCSVLYRAATLEINSADFILRGSVTLTAVIIMQLFGMAIFLMWREPGQILEVARAWRVAMWVGFLSLVGSLGWFIAFALQNVAYVKALGQVEILFSIAISALVFKEALSRREVIGIALLALSVVLIVLSL